MDLRALGHTPAMPALPAHTRAAARAALIVPVPVPVDRYDRTLMLLHWLVGIAVMAQLALGWWMLSLPDKPAGIQAPWFNLHKSIGLTLFCFVVLRLLWLRRHPAPALPAWMPRWQQRAAVQVHKTLYVCLIVLPLSGYLGSSFTRYPIRYFGQPLPSWGWEWPAAKSLMSAFHLSAAGLLSLLLAAHLAAALWHLARRDGIFQRIWPARQGRTGGES